MTENHAKLISLTDAAKRLGCSRSHVYNLVGAGKLTAHNVALKGTKLRVAEDDVDRYIKSTVIPRAAS